jgi:hypothetical protein
VEFDKPLVLLSNSESQFTSLVKQTGAAESEHLRSLASDAASKGTLKALKTDANNDDVSTEDADENLPLIR